MVSYHFEEFKKTINKKTTQPTILCREIDWVFISLVLTDCFKTL